MFDFFAKWFGSTTTNNKGEEVHKSHYKNGHFSLDLTFLVLVVVICLIALAVFYTRRYMGRKYREQIRTLLDVEMQELAGDKRSESNVVRAPKGRALKNSTNNSTVTV